MRVRWYQALFQQEQLEHWAQISEVQASTERKFHQNINHRKKSEKVQKIKHPLLIWNENDWIVWEKKWGGGWGLEISIEVSTFLRTFS